MIGELDTCAVCSRRPSRLAIVGYGVWRIRCQCGTRIEKIVGDSSEVGEPPRVPTERERATVDFINGIIADSLHAAGTIVQTYLASRGITTIPSTLRFAPRLLHTPSDSFLPAMRHLCDVNGEVIGLHRTYLASDGSGKALIVPNRMMLGRCAGGAVHLAEATRELGVGEGIESSLSAMEATGMPVWSALSTTGSRRSSCRRSRSHVMSRSSPTPTRQGLRRRKRLRRVGARKSGESPFRAQSSRGSIGMISSLVMEREHERPTVPNDQRSFAA